jgi:beta-xylosidase
MIYPGGDGKYWAVATNGNRSHVQTLSSRDLTTWEPGPDALPMLPTWSKPGKVWAPEVAVHDRHDFVLYYTTQGPRSTTQCISVAFGSKPQGPFVDRSTKPLVCQPSDGGSIDPDAFMAADGKRYLYWKNDGNSVGLDTFIFVQRLDEAGTRLLDRPKRLLKQDLPWEGSLIEAPFVKQVGGIFHLFYSANAYDSDAYAVGHAIADSPLGPFRKDPEPVLVSNEAAAGPGHCALFDKDGRVWMVYHAWAPDAVGEDPPGRTMWLSEVRFKPDGSVRVVPPTTDYPRNP